MENKEYEVMAELELNHWWYKHLHNLIEESLHNEAKKLRSSLSIFDIGCGTGGLIYRLKNKSFVSNAIGTDPHPLARKYAKKRGLKVKNYSIENLSKIKEKYDVVLCIDVLYHKNVNTLKAVKNLFKLLKPGGMVVINVAAMPSLKRNHSARVMEGRRFTFRQIKYLIESEGFEINKIFYWNSFLTPFIWLISKWQRFFPKSLLFSNKYKSSLKTTNVIFGGVLTKILSFENSIKNIISFPFGSSLFLSAYKPGK